MVNLNIVGKQPIIRIGLIHSLKGTMSLSEKPLLDAEKMAVDEINKNGGVLGCNIEPVIFDGASSAKQFAIGAKKLIDEGVDTLFGCWTSASRKAVRPIIEAAGGLLFYPVQYEGLEESNCICYTGSCLNQQIIPALEWVIKNFGNRVMLIGSDYVFPRTANLLIRSMIEESGASIVGEYYFPLGAQNFKEIIEKIQQQNPSVVFNTLNGDSNIGFYKQYFAAGISPITIPIIATSVTETELSTIADVATGHFACWSYFQSLDNSENQKFVSQFKRIYGLNRVVSDPMVAAYSQIYLWKKAVEKAKTFDPSIAKHFLVGITLDSPMGNIQVEKNLHLSKPVRIGKLKADGQFEVVWNQIKPIVPLPWLGVENLQFPGKFLVKQSLAALSENINYSVLLEKEIAERKKAEKIAEEQATHYIIEKAEKQRVSQLMRFQNTVIELNRLEIKMPLQNKLNLIMEMTAEAINVERVGIWFFDKNKKTISANNIFILSRREHIPGLQFNCNDFPKYFEAIISNPLVDADDAIRDPRTSEFVEKYLKPNGISSMMDVPIRLAGEIIGIVCNEHVGSKRKWSYEEQVFTSSIAGIISIAIEHDERLKAEERIKQSEEKYRFIAEVVPVIFWTAETNGALDFYNSRTFEYTGKTFEEIEKWGWLPLVHPDDVNKTVEIWTSCLATGKSLLLEHRLRRADGEFRWNLAKADPLKDNNGNIVKWFGTSVDIHEQKEAAEKLKLKNKELIAINKDLDNFIYTASHELKVPIINIEGLINILRSESFDEKQLSEILDMMNTSVSKFKNTVKDLTEITAIQRMREEDVEENDMNKIIGEVKLSLDNYIKSFNVRITSDTHECPSIRFSRKNLLRIVDNLLSNAIEFRSPNRRLEVLIKTEETDNNYILSISDNGLGISDTNKEKIFELFKKAHMQSQGRGLGLYIVKRIIENSGGRIELESTVGKGSTFKIYFKK